MIMKKHETKLVENKRIILKTTQNFIFYIMIISIELVVTVKLIRKTMNILNSTSLLKNLVTILD